MNTSLILLQLLQARILLPGFIFVVAFATPSEAQNAYYAAAAPMSSTASYQAYTQQAVYQQQWETYQQQMAVYQKKLALYHQQKAAYDRAMAARAAQPVATARVYPTLLRFDGRYATAPLNAPTQVQYAVGAANSLQRKPYSRGGGHKYVEDRAYDCSGSVSYVLIKAGLLRAPLSSAGFASYGLPGPGRYITIYVKPGEHVFMTVCGLRMDTGGGSDEEGPRWRAKPRAADGFIARHPAGF